MSRKTPEPIDVSDVFDAPAPAGTVALAAIDAEGNEVAFVRVRRDLYDRRVVEWMHAMFGETIRPTRRLELVRGRGRRER